MVLHLDHIYLANAAKADTPPPASSRPAEDRAAARKRQYEKVHS